MAIVGGAYPCLECVYISRYRLGEYLRVGAIDGGRRSENRYDDLEDELIARTFWGLCGVALISDLRSGESEVALLDGL